MKLVNGVKIQTMSWLWQMPPDKLCMVTNEGDCSFAVVVGAVGKRVMNTMCACWMQLQPPEGAIPVHSDCHFVTQVRDFFGVVLHDDDGFVFVFSRTRKLARIAFIVWSDSTWDVNISTWLSCYLRRARVEYLRCFSTDSHDADHFIALQLSAEFLYISFLFFLY
jgi:hypothetical protein